MTWTIFEQALGHVLLDFTMTVWGLGALYVCLRGNGETK